ncbi:glutathione S-transferase [Kordiimonas pumila]|uniref:Glutathione S-transferase n=1 Tax=Kordiimonas pumila TaxID=2161677 RepID=A0ABV7D0N7_9PROT|nr:glutathione S-transferase [Kordiimonas pumila]
MNLEIPILYSFRRCPYAMRARMAIWSSGYVVELREVVLKDKPSELALASAKATVPVLVLSGGTVLDESLDVMVWALGQNDPAGWLRDEPVVGADINELIRNCDTDFKQNLDRYKYPTRYENTDALWHRERAVGFLEHLESKLQQNLYLYGDVPCLADYAVMPFVRQFSGVEKVWFEALPLKALHRWLQELQNSAPFLAVMKKYPQWHAGDVPTLFGTKD